MHLHKRSAIYFLQLKINVQFFSIKNKELNSITISKTSQTLKLIKIVILNTK